MLLARGFFSGARLFATVGVAVSIAAWGTASARAAAPGSLDSSFGSGGVAGTGQDTRLFAAAVQSDGKVVVAGEAGASSTPSILVARFTAQGQLDPRFGSGGIVHGPAVTSGPASVAKGLAIQPDGKIVVVGTESDATGTYAHGLVVERYTAGGALDTGFGSGGKVEQLAGSSTGQGLAVAIQPDGKIIATGSASASGSQGFAPRVAVLRLTASGALDSGFAGGGVDIIDLGPVSNAKAVALQGDGKIVIAGSQAPGFQVPNALIARLTPGGQLDPSFASGGAFAHQYAIGAANSSFNALAIQPDGRIVAAGAATSGNTGAVAFIVRFTSGGQQDGSFGSGSVVYTPSANNFSPGASVPGAMGVQLSGGDIIAAGSYTNGGQTFATVWAFTSSGAADGRFGSGGTAVLPSSGVNNSEYAALVPYPATGGVIAAGDLGQITTSFAGLAARYVGFAPPQLQLSVSGVKTSYSARAVGRSGLTLTVSCNTGCTSKVTLQASAGAARRLHLPTKIRQCRKVHGKRRCTTRLVYKALTLALGTVTISGGGNKQVKLTLKRSVIDALGRHPGTQLTLQIAATSSSGGKQTVHKSIKFTR
jgi:uncharacterized delta-60 repeat protein